MERIRISIQYADEGDMEEERWWLEMRISNSHILEFQLEQ